MKKWLMGLLLFLFAFQANATPRYWGIDQLAGPKYCDVILKAHPHGFALGMFTQKDLFGDALPCISKVLARGGVPLVRYNLRWSDTHTFRRTDFPKIVAEAKRFVPLVNQHPLVECEFSGATEHQLNVKDAGDLAQMVLSVIPPRCKYVNNPWTGKGAFIPPGPRIKNEVHGGDAQPPKIGGSYNFSFDGTAAEDSNVTAIKQRLSNADVFFLWGPRMNGRWESNDTTPRPQRKGWPDQKYIRSLAVLATSKGPTNLPKNWIYKSHSENKGNGDPRAEKPVIIAPLKVSQLKIGTVNCSYYGNFSDGRSRYYCPVWGFEIADRIVDVVVNKKVVGKVQPAFRDGSWR